MSGKTNVWWRDPELGEPREISVPTGRMRVFERGTGPAIVLVHGALVNANLWRKVVPDLAMDFRCIALDLPFGAHELPMPGADYTPQGLADLIADAVEALELENVTLVGNDTGGGLCQILVTRRPDRIGRLVLTSCDAYEPSAALRITMAALKPAARFPALVPVMFGPMRVRSMRRPMVSLLMRTPPTSEVSDSYFLPVLESKEVRSDAASLLARGIPFQLLPEAATRFGEFDRPVLVAWSADDRIFPRAHAKRLASDFPDARLEWIEGARTFSAEDQPERLAELIAGFVREPAAKQVNVGG